jgi:phage-related minor tail protein
MKLKTIAEILAIPAAIALGVLALLELAGFFAWYYGPWDFRLFG